MMSTDMKIVNDIYRLAAHKCYLALVLSKHYESINAFECIKYRLNENGKR